MPRDIIFCAVIALAVLGATPAFAHEFWIEPIDFTVEPGEAIQAQLKNGQRFKGNVLSFNPNLSERFEIVTAEGSETVDSRIGDTPAVDQAVDAPGTAVIVHVASDSTLTYTDPAKFRQFVEEEGLDGTLEAHAARGLPEAGFREVYSRYSKALVKVGEGDEGGDREIGLPIELVLEGNPYAEPRPEQIPVRALYGGEPMAGALVKVFTLADGAKESELLDLRADDEGRVRVPTLDGPGGRYLLNVVKMREPDPEKAAATEAVWESLWASTTFATR